MLAALPDEDLAAFAIAEARLTHHDPVAGHVAAAVNKLCRSLIRGDARDVALRRWGGFPGQEGPGNDGGYAPNVLGKATRTLAILIFDDMEVLDFYKPASDSLSPEVLPARLQEDGPSAPKLRQAEVHSFFALWASWL